MFLRYIFKYIRRSAVTNLLFCLLLAFSGALLALSAGLWYSVDKSERELENMITTIAVPDVFAIRRYARSYADRNGINQFETEWGTLSRWEYGRDFQYYVAPYIQIDIFRHISEAIYRSGLFQMDDRRVYGAYVSGSHSMPAAITEGEGIASVPVVISESSDYEAFVENSPQSVAAFVVRCEGVEEVYNLTSSGMLRGVIARFVVERDIYLHQGRRRTRTVSAYFPYANPDGGLPVEAGKRYVIMGYNYSQGDRKPGWYNAIPAAKHMPNALYMDVISTAAEPVRLHTVNAMGVFESDIIQGLLRSGISAADFPMDILARIPVFDEELGYEGYTWFELDGTLEEALDSEQGAFIRTALSVAGISYNSLQVITTNDLNSFLRFNQRTAKITEGRAFNELETSNGERVCVISSQLAGINGLAVGDTLSLRLYPTAFTQVSMGNNIAWPPNPYHPKMNLTDALDFTVVGIYTGLTQEMNDHAISPNTVFIPAASFAGVGGLPSAGLHNLYDPPLLDTIIIPNGFVSEVSALIEETAEGYGAFFKFYDQGYSALKPVLSNLRFGMTWVLAFAAVVWVIILFMFSLFYIGRKRQETRLLFAFGVNKARRRRWVFIQCAVVIVLAQGLIAASAWPMYENILDTVVSAAETFTDTYRDYRLSEMNEAGGLQLRLPLDKTALGFLWTLAGETALLLLIAGIYSARAAVQRGLTARGAD